MLEKENRISSYRDWPIQQRIARVLQDEDFRRHCKHLREMPNFDKNLELITKIAQIDISQIQIDKKLLDNQNKFSKKEISADTIEFYTMLDELSPDGVNLVNRVKQNAQYLITEGLGRYNGRGYCEAGRGKDGKEYREIYMQVEGRISDTKTAIHEFAHSCTESFVQNIRIKDFKMKEIPTVITDHLSARFLKGKYPELRENFVEDDKFSQVDNVMKARECLMEALIVKVMNGEETYENVMKNYGHLYQGHQDILTRCLERIETIQFEDIMYEERYLVPQMIALEMRERFKKEPELVAKQLKQILAHEHDWTEEQALDYLGLPQREQLADDYVSKFADRMERLDIEKQRIKQEKATELKK